MHVEITKSWRGRKKGRAAMGKPKRYLRVIERSGAGRNNGSFIMVFVIFLLALSIGNAAALPCTISVDGDASDWDSTPKLIEDPEMDTIPFETGYDLTGVWCCYNNKEDNLYLMMQTSGVAGDTDGNGWNHNNTYVFADYPGISGTANETYGLDLDTTNDHMREYRIEYTSNAVTAQYRNGTTIPVVHAEGAFSDNNTKPGIIEMGITNASLVLTGGSLCLRGYASALGMLNDETPWVCINPGIFQPNITVNMTVKNATAGYVNRVTARPEESVTFKVTVKNTGACLLDAVMYDTLPDSLEWANDASPKETGKDAENETIWWNFSLDPGASHEIFFDAKVIGHAGEYASEVNVTGINQTSGLCVSDKDNASVFLIPEPGITIEKTVWDSTAWVDQTEVNHNDTVRFTLRVRNSGSCCNLTNVTVSDYLPASLEYVGTIAPFEPSATVDNYTWAFASLNLSEERTIVYDANVTGRSGAIMNNATVCGHYPENDTTLSDQDAVTLTITSAASERGDKRGRGKRVTITGETCTTPLLVTTTGTVITTSIATSVDGKASVTIWERTIARDANEQALTGVSITRLAVLPVAVGVPAGVTYVGYAYDIGPDGATFSQPVRSAITFDPADFEGRTPLIYTYETGRWRALETTIVESTATTRMNHFSTIVLFAGEEELGEVSEGAPEGASRAAYPTPSVTEELPEGAPGSTRSRSILLIALIALVTAGIVAAVVYRTQGGRKTGILLGIQSRLKRREKIESLECCKRGMLASIIDRVHGRKGKRYRKVWK
ncbi:MAG: DUF11 domain-containing protein [Methanomicrobia archaeon]|nr:DUF11 domain-containing protein [Methanomicrobia archaeon]